MSEDVNTYSDEAKMTPDYDVFISYAHEDRSRALWFVRVFEDLGWRVFWDEESVPVGVKFPKFLEEKLNASRSVVVLWTRTSINSDWVEDEARLGKDRGVLFPVLLDPNLSKKVPFGLRNVNSASLHDWDGKSKNSALDRLIDDLTDLFSRSSGKSFLSETSGKSICDHVPAAGVAGMTRYGPVSYSGGPENVEAEAVWSFEEFERTYGGLKPIVPSERNEEVTRIGYVAYTARAFFDNGGRKLYVSRVYSPVEGAEPLYGVARCVLAQASRSVVLTAQWPGSGGNLHVDIKVSRSKALAYSKKGIDEIQVRRAVAGQVIEVLPSGTSAADDEPVECDTLRVVREGVNGQQIFIDHELRQTPIRSDETVNFIRLNISIGDGTKTIQKFPDLSTCPEDADFVGKCLSRKRWMIPDEKLLPAYWREVWPLVWLDWHPSVLDDAESEFEIARLLAALQGIHYLVGGHDGMVVSPSELIGTASSSGKPGSGIAALEYNDIDVLMLPDAGAYRDIELCIEVARRLIESPGRRGFAIIDTPREATVGDALNFRDRLSGDLAVFYPWVEIDCPMVGDTVLVPPSGFVAGLFTSIDPLENPCSRPKLKGGSRELTIISDTSEKHIHTLEYERVNVLRVNDGRADLKGTEKLLKTTNQGIPFDKLRFIRLYQHIVKSIYRHLSSYFHEPITQAFFDARRIEIEGFLTLVWKSGALVGASADEAFNVTLESNESKEIGEFRVEIQLSLPGKAPYGPYYYTIMFYVYQDAGWQQKGFTPPPDLL